VIPDGPAGVSRHSIHGSAGKVIAEL